MGVQLAADRPARADRLGAVAQIRIATAFFAQGDVISQAR
jgi:hypothetical protein